MLCNALYNVHNFDYCDGSYSIALYYKIRVCHIKCIIRAYKPCWVYCFFYKSKESFVWTLYSIRNFYRMWNMTLVICMVIHLIWYDFWRKTVSLVLLLAIFYFHLWFSNLNIWQTAISAVFTILFVHGNFVFTLIKHWNITLIIIYIMSNNTCLQHIWYSRWYSNCYVVT